MANVCVCFMELLGDYMQDAMSTLTHKYIPAVKEKNGTKTKIGRFIIIKYLTKNSKKIQ